MPRRPLHPARIAGGLGLVALATAAAAAAGVAFASVAVARTVASNAYASLYKALGGEPMR